MKRKKKRRAMTFGKNAKKGMRPLVDIPNLEGYRLMGVFLDGTERPCHVLFSMGVHYVAEENSATPCFSKLYAWREIQNAQGEA